MSLRVPCHYRSEKTQGSFSSICAWNLYQIFLWEAYVSQYSFRTPLFSILQQIKINYLVKRTRHVHMFLAQNFCCVLSPCLHQTRVIKKGEQGAEDKEYMFLKDSLTPITHLLPQWQNIPFSPNKHSPHPRGAPLELAEANSFPQTWANHSTYHS